MTRQIRELENDLQEYFGQHVFGVQEIVHFLLMALIARGHVLLQGSPGVGKTLLSKLLAGVVGGEFRRIQGTADLMPSDITGVNVFDQNSAEFNFQRGPLFSDVVLFDEINRTGPKTQSALLEAMEERQITSDGKSFRLPENFLVIATQNPFEFEGTYPLPESELDRFLLMLNMSYPDRASEARVLNKYASVLELVDTKNESAFQLDGQTIHAMREEVERVHFAEEVTNYILDIAQATRESEWLALGISTRGALALAKCARIEAAMRGGEYVIPDDVQRVAPAVIGHRLVLTSEALIEQVDAQDYVGQLIGNVSVPR